MGIFDRLYKRIADEIGARIIQSEQSNEIVQARLYRMGVQKRNLRVGATQFDDNLTENLCGVIANRAVSQLVGHGLEFDFEGEAETAQETWFRACLNANKWELFSHRAALSAAEAGTGYITYIHDGMTGNDGKQYPRLVLLNPEFMTIETLPDDFEIVTRYIMQYKSTDLKGKEIGRKRVYENDPETGRWLIVDYESGGGYQPRWVEVGRPDWPYDFPPVLHWQNLPSIDSPHGAPEIGPDGYELQDRLNAVASNMSKVIRLYAHPKTVGVNVKFGDKVDAGPDQILLVTTDGQAGSGIMQFPPVGDMVSSMTFLSSLRRTLFDITRTVDIDSLEDKLGQVTNFGLRVLYQDNMSKVETKRRLFEDMVEELGRRLFMMVNMQPVPFEVVWPEIIPVNEAERLQLDQALATMEIVSKQTLSDRYGLDYETEQERIDQEAQSGYERLPEQ